MVVATIKFVTATGHLEGRSDEADRDTEEENENSNEEVIM